MAVCLKGKTSAAGRLWIFYFIYSIGARKAFCLMVSTASSSAPEPSGEASLLATLRSMRNVNRIIAQEQDPDKMLDRVVVGLVEGGHFIAASIARCDGRGRLCHWAEAGAVEHAARSADLVKSLRGAYQPDNSVSLNRQITREFVNELFDCPVQGYVRCADGRIIFSMPLSSRGVLCGYFSATVPRAAFDSLEEVQLFHEFGNDIAFALLSLEQHSQNRLLATAIHQCSEAVVITDADNHIQYVNPAFSRITGYRPEEVYGRNPAILQSGHYDDAFYKQMWQRLNNGLVWEGELLNRHKDGSFYSELAIITPIREPHGDIAGFVAIKRDITERRKWEHSLLNAQKLQAAGTMASSLAHDFNNLLTGVLGNLTFLRDFELPADHAGQESIAETLKAVERASALVEQLLQIGRPQQEEQQPVNAVQVAGEVVRLMRKSTPEAVEFSLKTEHNQLWLLGDSGRFHQVLLNLCRNAVNAIGDRPGKIEVRLRTVDVPEYINLSKADAMGKRCLLIEVADNGPGIAADVLPRIFEPFFSTCDKGEGSGLGLAVVHNVIQSFGGAVLVDSEPGRGSVFMLYVPQLVHTPSATDATHTEAASL
jgi:PAS domain S-box-containing protein